MTLIEGFVDEIEADLQQRHEREVTSAELGELVLEALQPLSEVAYIRFASVHRQFQGIRDFVETLDHLQNQDALASERPKPIADYNLSQIPQVLSPHT